MTKDIAHFAINADDVERARHFYESVFGWRFEAWGPPEFFHIRTSDSDSAVLGALQKRREIAGRRVNAFECTIAVDDVDAVARAIVAAGGKVLMNKTVIAGVGELVFFEDPEGNFAGAMRYDSTVE